MGKVTRSRSLEEAEVDYKNLVSLSKTDLFEIEGVNWLKRYIQAFEGFCEGAGISYAEGAFLQIEEEAGCQSLMVQDKTTGEIRAIHTEEDPTFDITNKKERYDYHLVEMKVEGKEMVFFAYPGMCSWGIAFGVNKTTGMIQLVDDMYVKPVHSQGMLWASAVGFMMLDCGHFKTVGELVRRIRKLPGEKFTGGYALQMIKAGSSGARMKTIEFIGDKIVFVKPVEAEDRLISPQSNYARDEGLQGYTTNAVPPEGERWTQADAEAYVEMRERYYRLEKMGLTGEWLQKSPEETITLGLEMLAKPDGDIGRGWTDEGRPRYFYTGMPTKIVAGHFAAYVNKDEVLCYMGKGLPRPTKGREYSLSVKRGFKYAKNKIWEMAEKERKIRNKKLIVKDGNDSKQTKTG